MNYADGVLHLGGIPATDLVSRFGSPLYVYESAILDRQIDAVRSAFSSFRCTPAYAMKANSNITLLRRIAAAGFSFDAVSPGEVALLRLAGVAPERIWFTCSNVSDADIEAIGDARIVINVNGMSELDRCIRLRVPNPIALRLNPDVGAGHHRDVVTAGFGVKFGFDLAEIDDAVMMAGDEGLEVMALHGHIGSGVMTPEPLLRAARALLEVAERIPSLRVINFGGGIGTPYRPGEASFPIAEYGERLAALASPFLERRGASAMIEPGRYLTAECGTLLTTVTTRRVSAGVDWLGCDTGFNHLARPSKYGAYHHIVNASRGDDSMLRTGTSRHEREEPTVVAGNICESGDVFTRDNDGVHPRNIGPAAIGDILAICDAGAYGFSMASEYNARLLPAEVLVENGEATLIRRRRTVDDLLRDQAL